jgi:hypothetical protein
LTECDIDRRVCCRRALQPQSLIEEVAMDRSRHTSDELSRALGEAIVRIWSAIPHDVQHQLFEDVINHQGESMRPPLAVYLHDRHPRTYAAMRARAVLEPDSLGG